MGLARSIEEQPTPMIQADLITRIPVKFVVGDAGCHRVRLVKRL